jgi:hypothetical protein
MNKKRSAIVEFALLPLTGYRAGKRMAKGKGWHGDSVGHSNARKRKTKFYSNAGLLSEMGAAGYTKAKTKKEAKIKALMGFLGEPRKKVLWRLGYRR